MAVRDCGLLSTSQGDKPEGIDWIVRGWMGEPELFLLIILLAIFFLKPLNPSCSV